jgi:MFS family permease
MESHPETEKQAAVPQTTESRTLNASRTSSYPQRDLRFHLAIASISIVCLASTIDLVILASALPVVSRSMGATSIEAYWCGTGFLMAQALSQPIYCTLQNTSGHKECMLVALGIFGLASILCATAENTTWLIAARVVGKSPNLLHGTCSSCRQITTHQSHSSKASA